MDQPNERWKQLCEQAAHEYDTEKLLKLIEEVNEILENKQGRNAKPSLNLHIESKNALADEA
jgi:hypothetical protein